MRGKIAALLAALLLSVTVQAQIGPSPGSGGASGPAGGDLTGVFPNPTVGTNAVTNAKAAQGGANTVKGNFTSGTANEADNAVPSCTDSAGNHINYTAGTGLTCGTSTSGITGLTSDVTATGPGSAAATIANNAVTNAKAAQAGANTMKGNWTGSTANEADNAMPACPDSGGNHLNYVTSTGVTCGTSGGGGAVSVTASTPNVVVTPSPGTGTFTVGTTTPLRANTTTSDPLVTADNGKVVTESNASAIAVSLAQAGSAGFLTGWSTCPDNIGAGAVTITPTTSTIIGDATLLIPQDVMGCIYSDGTNYEGFLGVPPYPGGTTTFLRGDGAWAAPAGSGTVNSGTAGQMTYYAGTGTTVSGNANATISSGALTLGVSTSALGSLILSGNTSGGVTIQPQAAAGTYNFNLPTGAGSSGQPLLSAGGAGAPMTFGTLGLGGGGLGLTSGTSGGILGFTGSTTLASSVALTQNALVLGGGAGATPTPLGSLGTTTTLLHGNAAGAPTFGAVSLTADVTGITPIANGGTNGSTVNAARSNLAIDQIREVANGSFPYQMLATDFTITTTSNYAAAQTATLPASSGINDGTTRVIYDQAQKVTGVNTLTIAPNGSDTLTGITSMTAAGGEVQCLLDKTPSPPNWTCYGSIPTGASGNVLIGQGTTTPANFAALTGDMTINNLGVTAVAKVQNMPYPSSCPFAGEVLNTTAANTFGCSKTPTLGSAGVIGTLTFGNATSGLLTLSPPTGAMGTITATLPVNTGTLAETNFAQTWSAVQSHNSGDLALNGATSGSITLNAAATAGSNTITLPAGTTDFSATGGTSQVVKQTASGGALTVARLACADLSDSGAGCSGGGGSGGTPATANTTAVTVNANSTAEQLLQELHPANGSFNTANMALWLHESGIFSVNTGTPTVTLKAKLCSSSNSGCVTLASVTSAAVITASSDQFVFNAYCGVAATGATGNLICHGAQFTDLTSGSTASSVSTDNNTAVSSNFDLTGANFIDFTVTFSSNQVTPNAATGHVAYVAPQGFGGTLTSVATTSPITGGTITATGTIACATCVTSAASLTSGQAVRGTGSQGTATSSGLLLSATNVTGYIGTVTTQSGTTYTLASTDCGTTVAFTNAGAVTLTTLNSLPIGCQIGILQAAAGQVTVTAGSGATQNSPHSFTKTFAQWAVLTLLVDTNGGGTAAHIVIAGDGA